MKELLDKVKNQFAESLPFVVYCKPNSDTITGLFQLDANLYSVENFNEKGFVFASFDGNQICLIPEKYSEKVSFGFDKKDIFSSEKEFNSPDETAKNKFETLVSEGIQAIKKEQFKKVVLSRTEVVNLTDFDFGTVFEKLVQLYPTTFVYCFFHPKLGMWMGATPEQLVQSQNKNIKTIALAGTKKSTGSELVIWGNKEVIEQQFVTDYIVKKLENVADEVFVSKPYSIQAGSIWHIKTDISGVLNSDSNLQQVVCLLHPTPAVCGFPKENSKAFILENEKYNRSFYTGYLGELNSGLETNSDCSDLFVNLRCMQIEFGEGQVAKAHLFIGCGITKDSIPEKEWEESVNKSMTMKKAL